MPDDIKVSATSWISRGNVSGALQSVLREAVLGALLTGLMVLLFLRDWRSSAIVVVTIPFALLAAVVALWGAGQTINIMTLGGLALAVGILVDEATVAIENIHTHLARGAPVARGVLDASGEVVVPRLLAMLSVVAVFVPSFFMTGVSRSLFVPLSLAVGFSMIASFLLSSSLVPVLSVWLLGDASHAPATDRTPADWVERLRDRLARAAAAARADARAAGRRRTPSSRSAIVAVGRPARSGARSSRPAARSQFQLRFRAPAGTKFESTERLGRPTCSTRSSRRGRAGQRRHHARICRRAAVVVPDQHDLPVDRRIARRRAAGRAQARRAGSELDGLRRDAPAAVRTAVSRRAVLVRARRHRQPDHELRRADAGRGRHHGAGLRGHASVRRRRCSDELAQIPTLRDLQVGQALDYPAIQVNVDRQLAGQLGVTVDQIGRSFAAATSSSRFVAPNYWADPRTGIAFQVQVEVPQPRMTSLDDLRVVPVSRRRRARTRCSATWRRIDNAHDRRRIRSDQRPAHGHADGERRRARISGGPRAAWTQAIARAGDAAARRDRRRPRSDRARCARRSRTSRAGLVGRGRRDLPAARRELSVAAPRVRRRLDRAGRAGGRRAHARRHADDAERAVVHGRASWRSASPSPTRSCS